MSDLKIWKAIWQINFPAAATIFDHRGAIATEWQNKDGLTEWRITSNSVQLNNKTRTNALVATINSITAIEELPDSYSSFTETAVSFTAKTLDKLNVRRLDRVGLRLIQIEKRDNFISLAAKVRTSIFRLTEDDWNTIGGYPKDVGFASVIKLDDYEASFNLGPMQRQQLVQYFEAQSAQNALPEVSLFVDVDLYKVNPKWFPKSYTKNAKEFLEDGGARIQTISEEFIDRFGAFK